MQGGRSCICKILRRWRTSCNRADNYEWGGAIDGSITSSMDCVARSMEFFQVGGPARDETGETHRRTNALIHGWGKYPWMINFYEWGATYAPKILSRRQVSISGPTAVAMTADRN